jgi:Asp-tRNA(Asn)/Glu-tRNA(Gln) amidotransferase A subunit family amidase
MPRANGEPLGALHGVPIAVKIFVDARAKRRVARVLKDWVPEHDATVVTLEGRVPSSCKVKLTEGAFSDHH